MEEYDKIHLRHIDDLDALVKGSPFEGLFGKDKTDWSSYHAVNYSDTLRLLLLYLYGGLYFDLDVISVNKIPNKLPDNFVIAESQSFVNGTILKFSKHHPFLSFLMEEVVSFYDMPTIHTYACTPYSLFQRPMLSETLD